MAYGPCIVLKTSEGMQLLKRRGEEAEETNLAVMGAFGCKRSGNKKYFFSSILELDVNMHLALEGLGQPKCNGEFLFSMELQFKKSAIKC